MRTRLHTGQLTQHPSVALDQTVARWLREGAPRVNSRSDPNSANRPFIPALFVFRWPSAWKVGVINQRAEAKSPIEAVLNHVRIRSCQEGNETGRNMASNGGYPGGRKCHFSPHYGGTILGTLFDYVVGSGVLTSYFRIGDEVSIGALVLWLEGHKLQCGGGR